MEVFFYMLVIIMAVPAFIFSIMSWRLRTPVMFWLGVVFTGFLLVFYVMNLDFILQFFVHIDFMLYAIFLILIPGIPVYFLIASKSKRHGSSDDSEVTDDYLTKIIESDDEEIKDEY